MNYYRRPSIGCIEWQGARSTDGYGFVRAGGKMQRAHRVAYCTAHGIELEDIKGMLVRHRCDNRLCVNPDHLEIGTHADNMRDMKERGRAARGEDNWCAKLTSEQVLAIRGEYVPRCREHGGRALARRYGVSQTVISGIVNGQRWTHV